MKKSVVAVPALLLIFVMPLIFTGTAGAIPAFTRQFKTECSTCHTIYPELNEYGQAFLKNGYVYTAKEGKEAGVPVSGGAGSEKTRKSEGILLSGIPEWLPVSLTANQSISYNNHPTDNDKVDFATRSLLLEGGGSFRELAGFYATFDLFTHNSTNQTDDTKLRELFLVWRQLFKTPVNIKFGKFEPKLSLWKRSDKVIATTFATNSYKVGDLNSFSMETPQDALEANAVLGKRVFVAAGVVDRKGQNSKQGYGHLSFKLGGADFLGNEPSMDLDSESIWDYLSLTMAGFGYGGRAIDPAGTSLRNDFYRAGGNMDLQYKRLRLRFSGVTGRDDNADFLVPPDVKRSLVLSSEAEYMFGSPVNVIGVFRYEYQDDGSGITRRYIPAVAYAPLQNIKLALQYNYESSPLVINRVALLDLMFSF